MCTQCVSNAEFLAGNGMLLWAVFKAPVHQALADVGLAFQPDPVAADARTVAFLRELDLDATDILGADVVAGAEAWRPRPAGQLPPVLAGLAARLRSARPIGSHSQLSTT